MELRPASIAQIAQARNGRWIEVDEDVGSVAMLIEEIGKALGTEFRLHVSEVTGVFKVVQYFPDGRESLVTTATELDGRLVERLREITSPGYDLAGEMEKLEAQAQAEHEYEQSEKVGDVGERLAHAFRHDLGDEKVSVRIPRDL